MKLNWKIGTRLRNKHDGYEFTLVRQESWDSQIWIGRGALGQGDKCIFETEAQHWEVLNND